MKNVFHAELSSTNKIGKNYWVPGQVSTPGDEVAGTCTLRGQLELPWLSAQERYHAAAGYCGSTSLGASPLWPEANVAKLLRNSSLL